MKRSLLIIASVLALTPLNGQKSIDALFNKYSSKDGFVAVTVSGNLFKLASCLDSDRDDSNSNSISANVTEIRILAPTDKETNSANFYDLVFHGIDLDDYEEFMRVKKSDQEIVMLVRSEGRAFREFLLVAGGEDNALVQIKGKMTFKDAKKLSNDIKNSSGLNIDMYSE
jgi:hypothetical protein